MDVKEISPEELYENSENYQLIDVRSEEEFSGELGHIEGAELITLGEDLDEWVEDADKDAPTVFICRSGSRSGKATMLAMENDFTDAYNMTGGMIAWNELGYETEK